MRTWIRLAMMCQKTSKEIGGQSASELVFSSKPQPQRGIMTSHTHAPVNCSLFAPRGATVGKVAILALLILLQRAAGLADSGYVVLKPNPGGLSATPDIVSSVLSNGNAVLT